MGAAWQYRYFDSCRGPLAIKTLSLHHPERAARAKCGHIETRLLRGAPLARQRRADVRDSLTRLLALGGKTPMLVTLSAGKNAAAEAYERSIRKAMLQVGIEHTACELAATVTDARFIHEMNAINADPAVTGILVLAPLPAHLSSDIVYDHLSPLKDVDGITPENAGRLHLGLPCLQPSTPSGGIALLDYYGIPIAGERCVVIGRSNVVGRPMASLLTHRNGTVTICHRQTQDLAGHVSNAEIVAVAAGMPGLITPGMIKPGATVLDFGINFVDGTMVGDVAFDSLLGIAGAVTPVPGGTGPVTAMILAQNTVAAGFAALRGDLDDVSLIEPGAPGL